MGTQLMNLIIKSLYSIYVKLTSLILIAEQIILNDSVNLFSIYRFYVPVLSCQLKCICSQDHVNRSEWKTKREHE